MKKDEIIQGNIKGSLIFLQKTNIFLPQEARPHRPCVPVPRRMVLASEGLGLWGSLWVQTVTELLVPLVRELARLLASRPREYPGVDRTLRVAVNLLTKAVLQYLPVLSPEPDFPEAWLAVLQAMQVWVIATQRAVCATRC
jgi:hypothetical protein